MSSVVALRPPQGRRRFRGRRRVLFFGTYDARLYPRVLVLKEGFEALGDEVLECNVPLGIDTAMRVRMLRRPWLAVFLLVRLVVAWTRLWWRARRLPAVDLVVVGYMGHFDVHLARFLWPDVPVVLDHLVSASDTAVDRRASSGLLVRLLQRLDDAAIRAADLPCVDTADQLRLIAADAHDKALVVPVGAANAWFRAPAPHSGRLRVVFFGSFTPLQGAPVIGEAAARLADHPEVSFTMIGRGQDYDATRAAAAGGRVDWIDWVEPEQLPSVIADHDVCLGIFGTGAKALRVVPNKVFQGAAAGAALVTSDTVPQQDAFAGAAVFVPPGDPDSLAAALLALANDAARVAGLRQAAHARANERYRPESIVAPLYERVVAYRRLEPVAA
ncbi:MAG TPA: glycosyltransferase [Gaiellaceae bacterium]|nr:glycosyltransferase [Gaiellaceae bacterium]